MAYSNYPSGFPQGITIRGLPLQLLHPGEIFWVHNDTTYTPKGGIGGNDGNPGTYQKPFATIQKALNVAAAGRGDIIACMPGFTLTFSAAAGLDLDVAGVALVGLGTGTSNPTISMSGTSTDIDIDAANISIVNMTILCSGVVAVAIDVNAAHFTLADSLIGTTSATGTFTRAITAGGSAIAMVVTDNIINFITTQVGAAVTDTAVEAIQLNNADGMIVQNNKFFGDWTTAVLSGTSNASLGITVSDNLIHNLATEDISSAIDLIDGCTGTVANNDVFTSNATSGAPTMMDLASCSNLMNFGNEALGEGTWPILIGAAAST